MSVRATLFAALLLVSTNVFAVPRIQHWTLKNGARVYFVQSRAVPMLDVNVTFDAGSARDPRPLPGLAMITNSMLGQGAANLDTDQIARGFDDVGAAEGASSDRDMAGLSLETLSEPKMRDRAVKLFAMILAQPTFPEASFQRKVRQALLGLKLSQQSLQSVADKHFMALMYGQYPYAHDPAGTAPGIHAMRRKDLIAFYHQYYVGRNAVVAIVGDVDRATAGHIADAIAGGLPKGARAPELAAVSPLPHAVVDHVDYPSVQSQILLGQPGIARNDPDYFPLLVGNYILGGDPLESRLAEEIRQKHGLSYTSYSYFYPMKARGPFVVSVLTRNAQSQDALRLAQRTLAQFVAQGPTAKELADAKRYMTGSFPLRIDSDGKLAAYLSAIGFYRLPLDYLNRFIPAVNAVTQSQIRAAFHQHVHPDRLVTLVVGGGK